MDSIDDIGVEGEEVFFLIKGEGENVLWGRFVFESMLYELVNVLVVFIKEIFLNMFLWKYVLLEWCLIFEECMVVLGFFEFLLVFFK